MAVPTSARITQFRRVLSTYKIDVSAPVRAALDASSPITLPNPNATAQAVFDAMSSKSPEKDVAAVLAQHAARVTARESGITGVVNTLIERAALQAITADADAIHAAASKALAPYLERLTLAAAAVPGTTPVGTREVATQTLMHIESAEAALKSITDVVSGLRVLYGESVKTPLILTEFPDELTRAQWAGFGRGIYGQRLIGAQSGATAQAYWYAVVSDLGGTFALQSPRDAKDNGVRANRAAGMLGVGANPDEVVGLSTEEPTPMAADWDA